MTILTKEERANHRSRSEAATCSQWMIRSIARDVDFCPYTELIRALDTIDALEAERDIAQETIDSCFEILEDMGFSTADPDGCGLPGIVCDMAGALNALSGGLK